LTECHSLIGYVVRTPAATLIGFWLLVSACSNRSHRRGKNADRTLSCPGLVTANLVAGHRSTAALHRGRYWHSGEKIAARRLLFHRAGLHDRIPVRWLHLADQPPPDPDLPRWASASQPGGGTGLHVTLRCHDGACLHSQDKVSNINVGGRCPLS